MHPLSSGKPHYCISKVPNLVNLAENQVCWAREKSELNTIKPNYCNLYRCRTMVIFGWLVLNYLTAPMDIFWKKQHVVPTFLYSTAKFEMIQIKKNNIYILKRQDCNINKRQNNFKKDKIFLEGLSTCPIHPLIAKKICSKSLKQHKRFVGLTLTKKIPVEL